MPLYKRKPFALVEKPEDLKPQELVFQIRLTKEIFRSYNEYLKRINLYRKRVWTCKATGKGNLTYEEALASEDKASKRIQNIPTQYVAPVLRDVQFSMLNLKDLVNSIAAKLQAKKHGISTAPPDELNTKVSMKNGLVVCNRKRKKSEETQNTAEASEKKIKVYTRRNKLTSESSLPGKSADEVNEDPEDQSIKYPIDDLLVRPTEEDRLLSERPSPCRDFSVPMDCVGDALMVWDFCASFGRLLNLSPFSLEDFENSLCYKDTTPMLLVESYSALLRLLVKDNEKFALAIEKKKRKPKITQITWSEYLCDFLETSCGDELSMHISTIKRGHYGLLEIRVKLAIFRELVAHALETDTIKDKLDEFIEERQALAATRRDEALDEGRKRREEKERRKSKANGKEVKEERRVKSGYHSIANEVTPDKSNGKVLSQQNHSARNSENEEGDGTSKKNAKKQKVERNPSPEDVNNPSKREIHKLMKNEIKESIEMKSAEERKEFLEREIEKRFIRTSPLGKDKNHCRYWFFRRDGRIFVESSDSTQWGYYQTKEELDALIGSLNIKGERERALKKQLQKFYDKICSELQKRSKEATQQIEMEEALVRRSTRVRAPPRENPALAFLKRCRIFAILLKVNNAYWDMVDSSSIPVKSLQILLLGRSFVNLGRHRPSLDGNFGNKPHAIARYVTATD
ncbi:hypothetical protein Salat_2486600 [Sesamum alatum]|uniref:DDT domain-containing protein n=1 Tax=Sesamum alatum TaxID=300844 RepID=A0AAE1XS78_9LAMI|nr:hypothetical protein Salat_2486600 [Sesamum alatum]